jgi:hypothetical protein
VSVGQCAVFAGTKVADERTFIARVISPGGRFWALPGGPDGFVHRIFRARHVAGHLHVGDIERAADFVEPVRFAVVGKFLLDFGPGNIQ